MYLQHNIIMSLNIYAHCVGVDCVDWLTMRFPKWSLAIVWCILNAFHCFHIYVVYPYNAIIIAIAIAIHISYIMYMYTHRH